MPELLRPARNRVLLAAAILVVALVVILGAGAGGDRPPATGAARLVPADALAYIHLSTDADRAAVTRALKLADRFPSFPRLRDTLLARLSAGGSAGIDFARDIRPWLGNEAALALLNTRGTTAGSQIIVRVADRSKAEAFLARAAGRAGTATYHGTRISSYGNVSTAFVGDFLVIGQPDSLRAAIDAAAGRLPSLARDPTYRRAAGKLPDGRVLDAYASRDGVRRLLAAQGGLLGAAGVLLDQPALAGTALALSAHEHGATVEVHTVLDPKLARAQGSPFHEFKPKLLGAVPKAALAYIGLAGIDRAAQRLLVASAVGTAAGARLSALITRAKRDLEQRAGVNIDRDVAPLFRDEVALFLLPSIPAPVLTLVSHTDDEQATRVAFAKLQAPLAKLFLPRANSVTGQAPVFEERDVGGTKAFSLQLGPGLELDYAVFDGKLVISTSLQGIAAVKHSQGSLADTDAFKATLGQRPKRVTSLVFLDFSQLLALGEQTGLTASSTYRTIRPDLARVRAVGAAASGGEQESITELNIHTP